jgi:cytochrome P450
LVLFDREKNFSSAGGWGKILDQVFPRGLMLMDFDEHRLHRKALGIAFKPAPMKAYLGALNDGIARRIADWHLIPASVKFDSCCRPAIPSGLQF